jgi:hypothetical protein
MPAARAGELQKDPPPTGHHAHAISSNVGSKIWQVATLITPILLTTWLTLWTSHSEDRIKQDIDKQSQMFGQQLQLSEELYKRRFDAYEKLYAQLVELNTRLQEQSGSDTGEWGKVNADQATQFNHLLDVSKLHMSRKVQDLSVGAWLASANGDGQLLSQSIHEIEAAMKTELDNWMLEEKGAPGAEPVPAKSRKTKASTRSVQ